MNNSQVAHVWAQQTKASGKGSNFYFDGPTLYSYGRHFVVAEFAKNKRGETCVLFNNARYSISTGRHQSYASRAINGSTPRFTVNDPTAGRYSQATQHHANLAAYAADLRAAVTKASKARKADNAEWYLRDAAGEREQALAYAKFFGLRVKPSMFPDPRDADVLAKFKALDAKDAARQARARKLAEKRAAEAKAKRAAEYAEALTEWRAGERNSLPYDRDMPIALRVNGDIVETSWGAQVPVQDARRALAYIAQTVTNLAESGASERHIGRDVCRIGEFSLDMVRANGSIVAGCHNIPGDEIVRLSAVLS